MPTPQEFRQADTLLRQFGYRLAGEVEGAKLYTKRGCPPCWVNEVSIRLVLDHKVNHDGLHLGVQIEPQKKRRKH